MGMEIMRLGEDVKNLQPTDSNELAKVSYLTRHMENPSLYIWMMSTDPSKVILPWWTYDTRMDEDIQRIHKLWDITSPQSFFDCLFLSQFKRFVGQNLYAIAPGYLKTEGWGKLTDAARNAYLRGQGCVYRLEGSFNSKLNTYWVPFAQPQCVIRDANFDVLWSLFINSRNDDVTNSMGFFGQADVRQMPQTIKLLIDTNDNRSFDLAKQVDWFGLYSSPISPDHGACAVIYTKDKAFADSLASFQAKFDTLLNDARQMFMASPTPTTAFRILSRHVVL